MLFAYWMLLALSSRLYAGPFAGICCRFGTEADTFFAAAKFEMGPKKRQTWKVHIELERKPINSNRRKALTFGHRRWCFRRQHHRWLCRFGCARCLLIGWIYDHNTFDFQFLQCRYDAWFHLSSDHDLTIVNQINHMPQHKWGEFGQWDWRKVRKRRTTTISMFWTDTGGIYIALRIRMSVVRDSTYCKWYFWSV